MPKTRYNSLKDKDLSDFEVWLDADKNRYNIDNFWVTLDAKLVAYTFNVFQPLGFICRFILALLGSNRYEPFPIGNNQEVTELWKNNPNWLRWLKWHVRNPWCDLRKFYTGFAYASEVYHEHRNKYLTIHWAKFNKRHIPFPEFTTKYFVVGRQRRGILSINF